MKPLIDMNSHLSAYELSEIVGLMSESQALKPWRQFVLSGYDLDDWSKQKAFLSSGHSLEKEVFPSLGFHPWRVARMAESSSSGAVFRELKNVELAMDRDQSMYSFVGEIGLDKSVESEASPWELQERVFKAMLEKAAAYDKPLVLHVVSAHERALQILAEHGKKWRGVVHGFSGSVELALRYVAMGLKISVGPNVRNENFKKLRQTLARPEIHPHLVFETDQPHSLDGPEPFDFELLPMIIAEVSKLTGLPEQQLVDKACQSFLEMVSVN
ncbi:MAG: TatD family hydrolase [Pseudomonadota bacterium]